MALLYYVITYTLYFIIKIVPHDSHMTTHVGTRLTAVSSLFALLAGGSSDCLLELSAKSRMDLRA